MIHTCLLQFSRLGAERDRQEACWSLESQNVGVGKAKEDEPSAEHPRTSGSKFASRGSSILR
jgi:hypothetical protein